MQTFRRGLKPGAPPARPGPEQAIFGAVASVPRFFSRRRGAAGAGVGEA